MRHYVEAAREAAARQPPGPFVAADLVGRPDTVAYASYPSEVLVRRRLELARPAEADQTRAERAGRGDPEVHALLVQTKLVNPACVPEDFAVTIRGRLCRYPEIIITCDILVASADGPDRSRAPDRRRQEPIWRMGSLTDKGSWALI